MQMCSRVTGVLCLANSIVGKQNVCRPILRLNIGKYVQGADSDIRSRKMSGQGPGQGIPDGT